MPWIEEELARQLWTIGDENRLRILRLLPKSPDCSTAVNVTQIAERLGLSQPTVSNHLARLRTLGIVRAQRQCRDTHYWIDGARARQILTDLSHALKQACDQH
jgi:ArsR family transcriptional regulator, arsenate/arsenite/antimonite-responsive transcriptional repressor